MNMLDETWMQQPEPMVTGAALQPLALQHAPALIETVFPAQKVSFEAQKERKANLGQTLTGLGSYWKGRKPLILVRAIVLGSLLPPTDDAQADLALFEKLMAFDDEGLARRAVAANALTPAEIARRIELDNPWDYFKAKIQSSGVTGGDIRWMRFPLDVDAAGISIRWKRHISDDDKLVLYRLALATLPGYEVKAALAKRPEEVDQEWLYAPVWPVVNRHYAHLGLDAHSFPELVEQLGALRYGHRPRLGDTFCGGGSIPFEAARLGCDVYASDLNPVACMLTWGALNIIGASLERRAEIEQAQRGVAQAVDEGVTALGIEHDEHGNRAKAYLYCLETRCPQTGWMVPLAPSWIISKTRHVIARLRPDHAQQRFAIDIVSDVSDAELRAAGQGTVQDGDMVYQLDGRTYRTPIKTLRGDYRLPDGTTGNRLRRWEQHEFKPRPDDIFQERLYCIQWISADSLNQPRQQTWFAAPSEADLERERRVEAIVAENLSRWQDEGLVPDMAIEAGDKTDEPIRTRGWTYWHHFFNARQILILKSLKEECLSSSQAAAMTLFFTKVSDWSNKGCHWHTGWEKPENLFYNQAFDTFWNYGARSAYFLLSQWGLGTGRFSDLSHIDADIITAEAKQLSHAEMFITDPPYADAVMYHEITEFFIAWLRKNPPKPFDGWAWDSRRALAIKGSGDEFRRGMVAAYQAMADHMPDNGMQCVMFTHQDTGVWSDLIGIFWAAGLQVVAAWYIATETTSELKKGGYVQGTVILLLKKRAAGDRTGFKQRLLPAVRQEVARQIETMMHLNDTMKAHHGEPVFNDSDLQMAGFAAALKVLTAYTHIGGEDVTTFALRPRARGEVTVVDEIVQQASETASSLLAPEGLASATWARLTGIERFYCRMLDMETTGAAKLDNYQNFAKAFRVDDYSRVMGDMRPNHARLKRIPEFASRDLTESTEIGATRLGQLIIALQQLLKDTEPQVIVDQLRVEMADFLEIRPLLVDLLAFIERKSGETEVRTAAEVLGARLKNLRFGD
jgi:adenine-specific DNA methylase